MVNAFYVATAVCSNLKHIHTHAAGRKFREIHLLCQEYYEKACDIADTLCEISLEKGEKVYNGGMSFNLLKINPMNMSTYFYEEAVQSIETCMTMMIETLESHRSTEQDQSVVSLLDEYIRYWKKERDYKIQAMKKDWEDA